MALAAGTKLGPYEILSPIGAGGMGETARFSHLPYDPNSFGDWPLGVYFSKFADTKRSAGLGDHCKHESLKNMAVRVGFEPTEPVKVQRFSRPPDSTTLAPHRTPNLADFPTICSKCHTPICSRWAAVSPLLMLAA